MTAPTCGAADQPRIGGRVCHHTEVTEAGGQCAMGEREETWPEELRAEVIADRHVEWWKEEL